MKVLLKTLPLRNGNYGGALQAIALSKKLERLGHSPKVEAPTRFNMGLRTLAKYLLSLCTGSWPRLLTNRVRNDILTDFMDFVDGHISTIKNSKGLLFIRRDSRTNFDAFVVGSDQVWRPKYAKVDRYMFSKIPHKLDSKLRFSYAASFGVSTSAEFSANLVKNCSKSLEKFTAVSVREVSGVNLCQELFNVNAVQVMDPTFFWTKEFYEELAGLDRPSTDKQHLLLFGLDRSNELLDACQSVASRLGLEVNHFETKTPENRKQYWNKPEDFRLPSPAAWLEAISKSTIVVTDSYHGVIFAIIFRKAFVTVGNDARGSDRFHSLLSLLGLEKQLLHSIEDVTPESFEGIDWSHVEKRLSHLTNQSEAFLIKALA